MRMRSGWLFGSHGARPFPLHRLQDFETCVLNRSLKMAIVFGVLDDKNTLAHTPCLRSLDAHRQDNAEDRTYAERRIQRDTAAVQLNQAACNGEPKPGSALLRVMLSSTCWNSSKIACSIAAAIGPVSSTEILNCSRGPSPEFD